MYIVIPGLIDLHTHVYWGGTSLGIGAEEFCRTSGVTTAVDTGSADPGNFAGFRKHVIEPSQVGILAYLHVPHAGIYGFSHRVVVGESEEMRLMNPVDAVAVAEANRDLIVDIKVRVGLHASGTSGIVPLDIALEVGRKWPCWHTACRQKETDWHRFDWPVSPDAASNLRPMNGPEPP
ncbi:putative amidohydrolase [Bradyrhizobium sp. AZCC 2176]